MRPTSVIGVKSYYNKRLRCNVFTWACPFCGVENVTPLGSQECTSWLDSETFCGKTVDVGFEVAPSEVAE